MNRLARKQRILINSNYMERTQIFLNQAVNNSLIISLTCCFAPHLLYGQKSRIYSQSDFFFICFPLPSPVDFQDTVMFNFILNFPNFILFFVDFFTFYLIIILNNFFPQDLCLLPSFLLPSIYRIQNLMGIYHLSYTVLGAGV